MTNKAPMWVWLVPVLTCGLFAPVTPFAIALKRPTKRAWTWFGASAAVSILAMLLVGSQPEGSDNIWTTLGAVLALGNLAAVLTYLGVVGKDIVWRELPPVGFAAPTMYQPSPPANLNDHAVAEVQRRRQLRSEARALVQRDPQMARDLRVGRPDLVRQYDDGGLVDINSAPAVVLVRSLGLTEAQAAHIVEARDSLGRFAQPDDLVTLAGLDQRRYDDIRELVILL
ncbi:MAG: helix-hairpin-helix domain-containing protein [Nocardioides sp.]|nr:helix-hairpin-helix domain-containing protein [Nocardioides sp.]